MIDAGCGKKGYSIWFGLRSPSWNQTNGDENEMLFDGEKGVVGDKYNRCS